MDFTIWHGGKRPTLISGNSWLSEAGTDLKICPLSAKKAPGSTLSLEIELL